MCQRCGGRVRARCRARDTMRRNVKRTDIEPAKRTRVNADWIRKPRGGVAIAIPHPAALEGRRVDWPGAEGGACAPSPYPILQPSGMPAGAQKAAPAGTAASVSHPAPTPPTVIGGGRLRRRRLGLTSLRDAAEYRYRVHCSCNMSNFITDLLLCAPVFVKEDHANSANFQATLLCIISNNFSLRLLL